MGRQTKYTRERLEPIVLQSTSINQVLVALSLNQTSYGHIRNKIIGYGIDFSHFISNGPSIGKRHRRYTDEEIFVENAPFDVRGTHGPTLRKRFIAKGHPEICANCHTTATWQGKPLKLQLDHINGNNRDNREENLRFLCPNCHSQTHTYAGRNKKKYDEKKNLD